MFTAQRPPQGVLLLLLSLFYDRRLCLISIAVVVSQLILCKVLRNCSQLAKTVLPLIKVRLLQHVVLKVPFVALAR